MNDTIAAISTGKQICAIGIIRLSGPDTLRIINEAFTPFHGTIKPRNMVYGALKDGEGRLVDRCLCAYFPGPASYTGEDCAELHCHGSPVLLSLALDILFSLGARQAGPGEFTRRAFLNGQMDLSQAESVIDLIDAPSPAAVHNAAAQLSGALRIKLESVYDKVLSVLSHFQAEVDYPEEDIDPFDRSEACSSLEQAAATLDSLSATAKRGRILREGLLSAIIGRPNAGKSSLLNALLGYDRAIVTDAAGTTRDTIEERILLGGTLLRLTDTAGLRQGLEKAEQMGIERSLDLAAQAELVIAVFDGSAPLCEEDNMTIEAAAKAPLSIAVINKADLEQKIDIDYIRSRFDTVCCLSALTGDGIDELESVAGELLKDITPGASEGEILTNQRQVAAAQQASACLRSALEAMRSGLTADAALSDAEAAMEHIGAITGSSVREDVTEQIFSRFCVGK